jgi:hypothetical protein
MYPFTVKFKIEIEKASEEMTVKNVIEYFKVKLKSENVDITPKDDNRLEFYNSLRFRLFNLMTFLDKGYIKVEKIGERDFRIIHRITLYPVLIMNLIFMLILFNATRQLFPIFVFIFMYLVSSFAVIGKQYSFFSNSVDKYLESEKPNNI